MLFLILDFFPLPCSYIATSPFVNTSFRRLTFCKISGFQLLKHNQILTIIRKPAFEICFWYFAEMLDNVATVVVVTYSSLTVVETAVGIRPWSAWKLNSHCTEVPVLSWPPDWDSDPVNAEIPAFHTVEHRVLLHVELQVTKYLSFLRRGLSSTIRSFMTFFLCPVFFRNQNSCYSLVFAVSSPPLLHMDHCRHLLLRKCWNSSRIWGEGGGMRKDEQMLVSSVLLMNCTSMGLNLLTQSSEAAAVLFFLSYLGAAYPAGVWSTS